MKSRSLKKRYKRGMKKEDTIRKKKINTKYNFLGVMHGSTVLDKSVLFLPIPCGNVSKNQAYWVEISNIVNFVRIDLLILLFHPNVGPC